MISAYLEKMNWALKTSAAHETYFPDDRELRKERNLKLGREIGYGVRAWSQSERDFYLQTLYGRFIVANSLDRTGVALDAKDWVGAIEEGIAQRNG